VPITDRFYTDRRAVDGGVQHDWRRMGRPVAILRVTGDLTAASEPFLREAYGRANGEGVKKLLLRLDERIYINSGGIAVLIQTLAKAVKSGQTVGISGASEHFRKIFKMVGITKFAASSTPKRRPSGPCRAPVDPGGPPGERPNRRGRDRRMSFQGTSGGRRTGGPRPRTNWTAGSST